MSNDFLPVLDKLLTHVKLCDNTKYSVYYPGSSHVDADGVIMYMTPELYDLAKCAAKQGRDHFHAKRNAEGVLMECEPEPYYLIDCTLTPQEMAALREARSSYDGHDHSSPQSWRPHVNLNEGD